MVTKVARAAGTTDARRWTPGQHSLVRVGVGIATIGHAIGLVASAALAPSATTWAACAATIAGASAVALGWQPRTGAALAALGLLAAGGLAETSVGLPTVLTVALLVWVAAPPPPPTWSLATRSAVDPGASWRLSPGLDRLGRALGVLASALLASEPSSEASVGVWASIAALCVVLDGFVPPVALRRFLAPTALLALLVALFLAATAGFVPAALLAWLAAWAPRTVAAVATDHGEIVFYDGNCGLCHGAVRFLMAEDADGTAFRFAPLHGPTFLERVPEGDRDGLPDSVVVLTADGRLLWQFAAVRHLLARLGGLWGGLDWLLAPVPRGLGDRVYEAIARVRHRLFARPKDACPLLPPELRARMLA